MKGSQFRRRLAEFAEKEFIRKSVLSVSDGFAVMERILSGGKYARVLEIGTYRGVSTAILAQFCERVIAVDLREGKMERDGQIFDRVRFWEAMGIGNVDLRLVDSEVEKARIVEAAEFDFAFVDGDHEGMAPARDFALVKRCGTVLFHDYGGDNGVTRLIDSLPPGSVTRFDMFALWKA